MIGTWPFLALMASALLHAGWNAIVRASPEPGDRLVAVTIASGVIGVAALGLLGFPSAKSLPYLGFGLGFSAAAIRLSIAAYRRASFALAYPVMRAGIPLTTLPVAAIAIHEWPRPLGIVGIFLIISALAMLALAARKARGSELAGAGYAFLSALCAAGYVTSDAVGVRLSGNALSYGFLLGIGNAVLMIAITRFEGRHPLRIFRRHLVPGLATSALSMSSFLLYIWAVSLTPVAVASALRETSVLFAMVIARFVIKDRIGQLHYIAAVLAFAGVAAIRLG